MAVPQIIQVICLPISLVVIWIYSIVLSLLPRKRKDINGQVLFMTGAGSGIGRCMSYKFAEYGAIIVCTDINKETAKETADNIKANGGKAFSYKLDVTNREEVYEMAKLVQREVGEVDILVNNAGIVTGKKFMDCPDSMIQKTMDVNSTAHFWTLKAFLGPMLQRNNGHIVSIASLAGFFGANKLVDYCASKFAAVGMMESLTMELWDMNSDVKTTTIAPYFIATGMFDGCQEKNMIQPFMTPEYVANEVVQGVLNNEKLVCIPKRLFGVFLFLKSIMPWRVGKYMGKVLNASKAMDGFKGRYKNE